MTTKKIFLTRLGLFFFLISVILQSDFSFSADPAFSWKTFQSEHFNIHFHDDEYALAKRTAFISECYFFIFEKIFSWSPKNNIEMVLIDETDFSNGSATPVPFNSIVINITPGIESEMLERTDYHLERLIIHELTHIFHLDKCDGSLPFFRKILGRHPILFPGLYQPEWLIEGLAVYLETDVDRQFGRGQGSFYDMKMRTEVLKGMKSLSEINMADQNDPYLYGYYFYRFIEDTVGRDNIFSYLDKYSDNLIPSSLNTTLKEVFGLSLDSLWNAFVLYMDEIYQPQIKDIRVNGLREGNSITRTGDLQLTGFCLSEEGSLYYIEKKDRSRPALMIKKPDKSPEKICAVNDSARIDIHPSAGILLSMPEFYNEHAIYQDLFLIRPGTRKIRRITRGGRYVWGRFMPDGSHIIGVNLHRGKSALHLLSDSGQILKVLWEGATYETIGEMTVSPDGQIVASVSGKNKGWNLAIFNYKKMDWELLTNDNVFKTSPFFSKNGNAIYFSADYDGIYNIYCLDLITRNLEQLTSVMGGAFHPVLSKENTLYYIGYHTRGYDIFSLAASGKKVESKSSKTILPYKERCPLTDDVEKTCRTVPYSPFKSLRPRFFTPFVSYNSDTSSLGVFTIGNDALNIYHYGLGASYDISFNRFSGYLALGYSTRFSMNISRSNSYSFEDYERQSDSCEVFFNIPFFSYHQFQKISVGAAFERNYYESDDPLADSFKWYDHLLGIAFIHNNTVLFRNAVSESSGRKIKAVVEHHALFNSDYEGETYTFDYREFLPVIGKHVLALRWVNGFATRTQRYFELGDFTNISYDSFLTGYVSEPVFNNREVALRGYPQGLSHLIGQKLFLGSVEWRYPVLFVNKGYTAPPVGIKQIAGSFFFDIGTVWDESTPDDYYKSIGTEFFIDMSVLYQANIRVRFCYAHGLDLGGEDRFSVYVGPSF